MAKVSWTVALVVTLACSAVASAQTPPVTSSAQQVSVAAPSAAVPAAITSTGAEATPAIDLARIFAAPKAPAISTMPEPKLASCTLLECKAPCRVPGCFAECLDITTCTCDTICN
ncbi:MAG TPA: hypothetical protein VH988_02355 [Thermoanaerobaculia bacterium]|nr:hypothetical protein [Thermoanaerobaculia bacterium]